MTSKKITPRVILKNLTSMYLLLLLTVFLLFCGSRGYQGIIGTKFSLFCVFAGVYIVISLVLWIECALVGEFRITSFKAAVRSLSLFQRSVLLYLIFTWISVLMSPYTREAIVGISRCEGAVTITLYGLSALLVSKYAELSYYWKYLLAGVSTVFCLICIVQLHGGNPFSLYPEGYNYWGAYVDYAGAYLGTIGNVDLVASFLCMAIPLLIGLLVKSKEKSCYVFFAPLILSIYVLVKMSVLAGFVGVIGSIVLSLPIIRPRASMGRRKAWLIVLLIAISFVGLVFLFDIGNGMLHELHEILHGRVSDDFGSGRFYIWREILLRVPENFWFGTGPDTMLCAGIEGFSRYDNIHNIQIVSEIDVAHNEYLNVLFHQGIFACASFMMAVAVSVVNWLRLGSENKFVAIIGMAVVGYSIQAFFGFSMCVTAPFFWALLGLLDGCATKK